jgi:hypothetical protein
MQAANADRKVRRARYANGIQLPRGDDGRCQNAKRFRRLVTQFASELGGDLTAADEALVKNTASLVLAAEQLQVASVNGADVDIDSLIRVNSEARRNLVELQAKSAHRKPAGPSVADIFSVPDEADEAE